MPPCEHTHRYPRAVQRTSSRAAKLAVAVVLTAAGVLVVSEWIMPPTYLLALCLLVVAGAAFFVAVWAWRQARRGGEGRRRSLWTALRDGMRALLELLG